MYTSTQVLEIINQDIEKINWQRIPVGLYEPIGYILSLGGKRIRPVLTLMSYNLYDDDLRQVMNPALGLEIFHNFTLLHDDIMDRADMRRGKPTVHKKWNDNTAILSGDVMQIEAYKFIAETPKQHLKTVLDIFSKTAAEICEGQQFDMEFENRDDVSVEEYIEMIRLKTAVLLAAGAQIGAIVAGGSTNDALHLYNFGIAIGLAFQLKDDLLDVYGNEANFGKKIGGDILCNKKTFLLINALKAAQGSDREELFYWLKCDDPSKKEEKITSVTKIYNNLGMKNLCEKKILYYHSMALDSLKQVKVAETRKSELLQFTDRLVARND